MEDVNRTREDLLRELKLLRDQANELLETKEALHKSQASLGEAQQVAHIGHWEWKPQTNALLWSDENYRIFGLPHRPVPSLDLFFSVVHPDDLDTIKSAINHSLLHKTPHKVNIRIRKDGDEAAVQICGQVESDATGAPVRMFGTVLDITDRARAEEALKKSEERYHDLFENAIDAIFLVDKDHNYIDVNRKAVELSGYSREELLTMNIMDLVPQEQRPRSRDEFTKLTREGQYEKFRGKIRTKAGRLRDVEVSSSAIMADGSYIGSRDIVRDITDRVAAEDTIRLNEARLRQAQQIAHIGNWSWDVATNGVDWSDELFRIYGYEPGEIVPDYQFILRTMHPDSREEFLAAIDAALKGERLFEMDYAFFRKDGSEAALHTIGQVVRSSLGKPLRMVGTVQDVTAQKKAAKTLRESEEKFHRIFDTALDGILILRTATKKFVEANRTICAMLGYTREEMTRLGVGDIHPEKDMPMVLAELELQMRGDKVLAEGLPVKRKDGTIFYADISAAPFMLAGEECSVGIFRDISERKQTEQTLKVANTRLRTLIQAIPDLVIFKDSRGKHLIVNRAAEEVIGQRRDEVIGKTVEELLPPGPAGECRKSDEEAMQGKSLTATEEQVFEREGRSRYIEMLKAPMLDDTNAVVGLVAIGRDITERKKAEEALRNSERFIRTVLDTVDEAFIVIDPDFRIVTANKAYGAQAAMNTDAVIGRHCYEISHRTDRPCHEEGEECAVRAVFTTGEPHTAVHRHHDAKGGVLYVETKAFPIRDGSGSVTSVIETVNNITEKHLLEEERLKTQKLEAIGTLAGGIAHDFNNLLQGVFGYISMAKMNIDRPDTSLAMLEQAEQALHLSVNLTKQLLTFSKGGKPVKKPLSLARVIENSVKFALSGSRVDYRLELDQELWMAEADEGQLSQVIQNIVLNADQAMPLGGTILITGRNLPSVPQDVRHLLAEGSYIELAIQDTGIGISGSYLGKIFDPYFTTKEKGSGLGLATSYSIIKNHGGAIDVASEVDRGSTFRLYLPAIEKQARAAAAAPPVQTGRAGRILVMDDEELIRNIASEMIKAAGHEVEVAEHGEAALEKFRAAMTSGRPFDVVLLDLTIRGGLGGRETITQLLAIDPSVKAIVSSGYSDDAAVSDFTSYGFRACLAKPYEVATLHRMLDELMAQ